MKAIIAAAALLVATGCTTTEIKGLSERVAGLEARVQGLEDVAHLPHGTERIHNPSKKD